MSAMGIGAVIGTLVLARRTHAAGLTRVMVISGLTTGVTYLAFAFSTSFYLSLAIMPLIGYSVMRQMASANTTIQTLIPEAYRGRIMALYAMTVVGLGPFGSLGAGALASHFGARATMAMGGVLALLASGVFALTLRRDPIAA
jgi:predicted MFS family arabinose efflux permease